MPQPFIISPELAPRFQIRQFQQFRWGLILTEYIASALALVFSYQVDSWPLVLLLLTLHGSSNIALGMWSHGARYPERIFALGILADLLILTLLLALSGGAGNGLIALLLLPVAVCAVLLPPFLAYLTALLAVVCYTLLLQLGNQPAGSEQSLHLHGMHAESMVHQGFNQHLLQMGWAFALSALLLTWFISSQARLIRQKSQQLNELQQQQSRQEHMLAVATYAANAAHDLATPLQNISLLSDELQQGHSPAVLQDLQTEVQRCQQIVQQLRSRAQQLRTDKPQAQPVLEITLQAIQLWLVSRPEIQLEQQLHSDDSPCRLPDALAWSAALFNILDNAADASLANQQPRLKLELSLQAGFFCLRIQDFGTGMTAAQLAELGQYPLQSSQGLGLGQFLANASVERLGGKVLRQSSPTGGMLTLISYQAGA